MLEAFIIEEIKRLEKEKLLQEYEERPRLELPIPLEKPKEPPKKGGTVIVIET